MKFHRIITVAIALMLFTAAMPLGAFSLAGTAVADEGDDGWEETASSTDAPHHPVIDEDRGVLIVPLYDSIVAYDEATGAELWRESYDGRISQQPAVADGFVYFTADTSTNGDIYAVDTYTGDTEWSGTANGASEYVVVNEHHGLVITATSYYTTAFDADTGSEVWTYQTDGWQQTVATTDDLVVIGEWDHYIIGLDAETGSELWVDERESAVNAIAFTDDRVYVELDEEVAALDHEGERQWDRLITGGEVDNLLATDDRVVVYDGGDLTVLTAEDGTTVWSDPVNINRNMVHAVGDDGEVIVVPDGVYALNDGEILADTLLPSSGRIVMSGDTAYYTYWTGSSARAGAMTVDGVEDSSWTHTKADASGTNSPSLTEATDFITGQVVSCGVSLSIGECPSESPVPHAWVETVVIDYDKVDEHIREPGEELLSAVNRVERDLYDTTPDVFDESLNPVYDIFEANEGEDVTTVIINPESAWGLEKYTDGVDTHQTGIFLESNEPYVVTAWDLSESGWLQDSVDRQLPGRTVSGGEVEFRKLSVTGETTAVYSFPLTNEYATSIEYYLGRGPGKTHEYARVQLPPGWYVAEYVPEEGETETIPVPIQVGSTSELFTDALNTAETDLRGLLTDHAERTQAYIDNDIVQVERVQADHNGEFAVGMDSRVETVHMVAYKGGPDELRELDPMDVDYDTMVGAIESLDPTEDVLTPVYVTKGKKTVDVPAEGVKLETVRLQPPVDEEGWLDFLGWMEMVWEGEQYLENLVTYFGEAEEDVRERAEQVCEMAGTTLLAEYDCEDVANLDEEATFDLVNDFESEFRDRSPTYRGGSGTTTPTIGEDDDGVLTVDADLEIATGWSDPGLGLDDIVVTVYLGDGTTVTVEEEYIDISRTLSGSHLVEIRDYPLPNEDASAIRFGVSVVDDDGHTGRADGPATENPRVSDGIPRVDSLGFDTLRPVVGDSVTMRPASDDSRYRALVDAEVFAPDGSSVFVTVEDGTLQFTAEDEGRYVIRYTIEDVNGVEYTETVAITAHSASPAMPPSVRVEPSIFGSVAVTGDGITGATIEERTGSVRLVANLHADATGPVSVYLTSIDASDISLRLLDEDDRALDRHRTVYLHTAELNDDALVWTHGHPTTGVYGEVRHVGDGTVIHTFADDTGKLDAAINNNPTLLDKIRYEMSKLVSSLTTWTPPQLLSTVSTVNLLTLALPAQVTLQ